jgi:rhomboid protease GluP
MRLNVRYNAPVVLTFSLLATGVLIGYAIAGNRFLAYFVAPGRFNFASPIEYVRLFTHVLGHESWRHLMSNLLVVLLIGPLLEEKYGSGKLLMMMCVTAFVTGVLNVVLFNTGLLGASGIAFMLIVLSSMVNLRKGELPMTFVLVAGLFIGGEIAAAVTDRDNISQFAHIVGGLCGAAFGFRTRE